MKKHLIVLFLSFICLTAVAQEVTLTIRQDYLVPDIPIITQNGDLLRSSSPIGNQWFKDGVELPGQNDQTLAVATSGNYKVSVTLRSSSPIGNQWYKDGVELPGENKQKLIVVRSGNYKVSVTLGSGCSSESTTYPVIKTDVSIIQTADFTCRVFPNPNNGMFTVELESDHSEVFELELFTSNGESVAKQTVNHPSGKLQIPFGKTSLADGVYYLQIKCGSNILSRQIIVN